MLETLFWLFQCSKTHGVFCHRPLAPAIFGQSITVSTRNSKVINMPLYLIDVSKVFVAVNEFTRFEKSSQVFIRRLFMWNFYVTYVIKVHSWIYQQNLR